MPLDDSVRSLFSKVSSQQRWAFFSCAAAGYLTHLYAFTNLYPNSDGLSRMFDPQQMTISGRWFLHYASVFNGFTQMPAVIGFFSVLFLSLAAALAVAVLGLNSRVLSAFAGAVMAVFPPMGYTYLYLFTASAYAFAILCAVLAVWLAAKGGFPRWLAAVCLLAISMGTYQAYAAVAVAFSLLSVLHTALLPQNTVKQTSLLGLRLVCFLLSGALLYYGILQIFLAVKDLELLDYLGMSQTGMGTLLLQLPRLVLTAYKQVISFFLLPGGSNSFTTPFFAALTLLLAVCAMGCLLSLWMRGDRRQGWRFAGTLVMLALLPLGAGFAQVIAPFSDATPIMKYAYVSLYLAALLLIDTGLPHMKAAARPLCGWLTCGVLLVTCLYSANIDNLLYTASAQAHRSLLSYATVLLSRVESCPGYDGSQEVVIIGSFPTDRYYSQIGSYLLVDHYSVPIHTPAPLNKHIYYYLNDWLNVPIQEPAEETMKAVAASSQFKAMPLYPADGSVALLDGRVVVKVQETYTPKSDYEIAYENRR